MVNLFSSLAQWQTVCTTEKVYEDGVLASKYGTYPRTETQAFEFDFYKKTGEVRGIPNGRKTVNNLPDLEEVSEGDVKIKSSCGDTKEIKDGNILTQQPKLNNCFQILRGQKYHK